MSEDWWAMSPGTHNLGTSLYKLVISVWDVTITGSLLLNYSGCDVAM